MIRKSVKWTVVSISFVVLLGIILTLQEYWPLHAPGLFIERVRQKDLVADLIYPSSKEDLPIVVFLGGSGGGLGYEEELKALASNGYAVLSLAYFKEPGLPGKLESIPLEYFERAFDWLKTREQLDTAKLLLMGVSRGAELALLLGSTYPQVKGVIAYAPGCFVLPNSTEVEKDTLIASWTLNGEPVTFGHIKRFEENSNVSIDYRRYIDPLLEESVQSKNYVIKVERINGPVLLISGERDLVWPSSQMANRIEKRLKEHRFGHEVSNVIFKEGGHDVLMFRNRYPIVSSIVFREFRLNVRGESYQFNLGGTISGVIGSKVQSRTIALQFLERFRKSSTP